MEREGMIAHLKAIYKSEMRAATLRRPYLDKYQRRRVEAEHTDNVVALKLAIAELEGNTRCPEPIQEVDEYRCLRCNLRWDTREDKPQCLK